MSWFQFLLGSAGNIAFGWACIPTAWRTWKAGKSIGTPISLAWNIWVACILFYGYMLSRFGLDPFLLLCSSVEIAAYSVVIRYHYFPRDFNWPDFATGGPYFCTREFKHDGPCNGWPRGGCKAHNDELIEVQWDVPCVEAESLDEDMDRAYGSRGL